MAQTFTKEMARNIFYGGSAFFFLLFLALTFDTHLALPQRDQSGQLDPSTPLGQSIARGKALWEENNCIGCHTLLGEGAYFAPELGNVYKRFGENPDAIKGFIQRVLHQLVEGVGFHPRHDRRCRILHAADQRIFV